MVNVFWQIDGFESNSPIFHSPKLHSVMSSSLHNHSFHVYNRPAAGHASVIVGMEFTIDNCIQGHHVSKEFWTPEVGEELACQCEEGNPNDVCAVAVKTDASTVVGHLTRKISAACSLFLRRSGTIMCQVTGSRLNSQCVRLAILLLILLWLRCAQPPK